MKPVEFAFTPHLSPKENMRLDRDNLKQGKRILRFYTWSPPAISLGITEDPADVVNQTLAAEHGIDIVRRITGGAAVLHEDDFTYSIILAKEDWEEPSVHGIYDTIAGALAGGLQSLGIKVNRADTPAWQRPDSHVCFEGPAKNELLIEGRKICGSAQSHKRGWVLQHGSIMVKNHTPKLCKLLNLRDEAEIERIAGQTIALDEACRIQGKELPQEKTVVEAMFNSFATVLKNIDLSLTR